MQTQLTNILFVFHVGILVVSAVCFAVSFLAALFYLLAHWELKSKKFGHFFTMPSLEVLDRTAVRSVVWGVVLLTVGNGIGIYLAHVFWKVNWLTNAKFLFSVATWVWFVTLLLFRHFRGWRGKRFFASVVVGFVFFLTTALLSFLWKGPWT